MGHRQRLVLSDTSQIALEIVGRMLWQITRNCKLYTQGIKLLSVLTLSTIFERLLLNLDRNTNVKFQRVIEYT